MNNTETLIMDYIKQELVHNANANISPEDDLLESGIINSLGILQIVSFVEDTLGIDIPAEDVVYENFHSVAALSDYLSKQNS